MNELDTAIVLKEKGLPFEDRLMVVIGGRFVMTKDRLRSLKLAAACYRLIKATAKVFWLYEVRDWLNRILGGGADES